MDEPLDPDLIAGEPNALVTQPAGPPSTAPTGAPRLEGWLSRMAPLRANDLLLVAGCLPSVRMDSRIRPLDDEGPPDGIEIEEAVLPAPPPYAALPPCAARRHREVRTADGSL